MYCAPGERFYCNNWTGAAPNGWGIDAETTMFLMVWHGPTPDSDAAPEAISFVAADDD